MSNYAISKFYTKNKYFLAHKSCRPSTIKVKFETTVCAPLAKLHIIYLSNLHFCMAESRVFSFCFLVTVDTVK